MKDTARTVNLQCNVCKNVATITASPFLPHDTSFENVSIPPAVTTVLPATETAALAETQMPLADDDNVSENFTFG